ncbi:MAG TPA: response regulator [Methanospirillum sp.]|nr:response regulator [Methanospirillum sp.]
MADELQVLIVDDNQDICMAIQAVLEDEPYTVLTASGGEECIHILEQGFSGLILLDIMMPDMDGWATIREIVKRDLYHHIAICMLTALDNPDEGMLGIEQYVSDYITKPLVPDLLIDIIRLWMDSIPDE